MESKEKGSVWKSVSRVYRWNFRKKFAQKEGCNDFLRRENEREGGKLKWFFFFVFFFSIQIDWSALLDDVHDMAREPFCSISTPISLAGYPTTHCRYFSVSSSANPREKLCSLCVSCSSRVENPNIIYKWRGRGSSCFKNGISNQWFIWINHCR